MPRGPNARRPLKGLGISWQCQPEERLMNRNMFLFAKTGMGLGLVMVAIGGEKLGYWPAGVVAILYMVAGVIFGWGLPLPRTRLP